MEYQALILITLAIAIAYLHSRNIAHRDLKCENILVTTDMNITLIDFGFAKSLNPNHPMLNDNCGSPQYASPEVVMCLPYDPRKADIWSLGVILYALFTGQLPFTMDSGGNRKMLHKIARGDFFLPESLTHQKEVTDLIKLLLITNPSKRPDMGAILDHNWLKSD